MTTCKKCGEEVEDEGRGQHIVDSHADLVDEALQEYMSDAEADVERELFE